MSSEDQPALSRRVIVTTGAKLAYAAPLVAASMRTQSAQANGIISGAPNCDSGSVLVHGGCFRVPVAASCDSICGALSILADSGGAVCAVDPVPRTACSHNEDCPVGQACSLIYLICVAPC